MGFVADKINDILEAIFKWIVASLKAPFDESLYSLKELVFGKAGDGKLIYGTFQPTDISKALDPLYFSVATLAGVVLVAFIAVHGMRISGASINPSKRNEMIQFFWDLLIVMFVLFNLTTFYDLLFQINNGVVNLFSGQYDSKLDSLNEEQLDDAEGVIGFLLVQLVLLGLAIWANFYYFMRKVTLIILMALGPLMMIFYLNPKFKGLTGAWMKEIIGSIFVQSIHSFVFWTVAVLSATSNGLIETVILYAIFIPISESLRGLFGMGGNMQGNLNKAGAMMGMAALSGMYGAAKGALGDQSVMGAVKGMYNGAKGKMTGSNSKDGESGEAKDVKGSIGANAGSDTGTSDRAEKMLRAGDIFSRAGKATMGAAGAIAGMGLGPVGSMAGASLGAVAGDTVGGLAGRASVAGIQGLGVAGSGLLSRINKGKEAAKQTLGARNGNFEENLASSIADRETASWADQNKESVMSAFKERFPDATPKEAEAHFNSEQAKKREGFLASAKSDINSIKENGAGLASGSAMVNASSSAMANKWANDNQTSFNEAYDKENLKDGETPSADYLAKRNNAFGQKKNEMKSAFAKAGNQFVSQNAVDGSEPISRADFQNHMRSAVGNIPGVGNASNLVEAGNKAVNHVTGASVLGSNGKPNESFIVGQLAAKKTSQMKEDFKKQQTSLGVSEADAIRDWDTNHQVPVHKANVQSFKGSMAQASQGIAFRANPDSISAKISDTRAAVGSFVSSASGLRGIQELNSAVGQGLKVGYATNSDSGFIKQTIGGISGGWKEGITHIASQQGGAVEAQSKLQNIVGYTAGAVLGPKGYQIGKKASMALSPFKSQVQEEIQSVSEVIQMARTTTDAHGNTQIAPGAIRQVITRDASYIEVQTKGGNTQMVSRKGAGHSTLRKGEVVYQDLQAMDDSLVVASPKGGQSSTYRLDSGGGRIPSRVQVSQNPVTLLSDSAQGSVKAAPVQKSQLPIFNQKVDSGSFTVEELNQSGMTNAQVVVEKNRQYVTAQKDNITYRVSPVFSGDTRLGSSETVNIPVMTNGSKLRPAQRVANSLVGVQTTDNSSYYSSKTVEDLIVDVQDMMHSKHEAHANRSVERRNFRDVAGRKQGLLG